MKEFIPLAVEKEYVDFLLFLKQQTSESVRKELGNFAYPFYVYIYLLFLKNNKNLEGKEFLSSYIHIFTNSQATSDVLKPILELQDISSLEEFSKHPHFKKFLECQCTVFITDENMCYLRKYFEKSECVNLCSIFRERMNVSKKLSYQVPEIYKTDSSELGKSNFNEILKKFTDRLSPFKNIYKVIANGRNLCCVDINYENTQLICGYESGAIHFWNLTSNFYKVEMHGSNRHQYVSLAANSEEEYLANDGKKISVSGSDKMLSGHTGAVYGVVTSPSDSNLLVSCSQDGTVRAWNLSECETVALYTGFFNPVWDVAVSNDSKYFASASENTKLWNFEYQLPLQIFKGHLKDIDCVTFHPTSKYIATAADNIIKIWSMEQEDAVRTFSNNESYLSSVVFSPNGYLLASANANGHINIFDVGSGKIIKEFQADNSRILSISFNKQGTLLATGGFDKYLKVWDIQCSSPNTLPLEVSSTFIGETVHLVKFLSKDLLASVSECRLTEHSFE